MPHRRGSDSIPPAAGFAASTKEIAIPTSAPPAARGQVLRSVIVPSLFLMVAMFNLTLCVAGLKELMVDQLGGTTAHASWFFSIESLAYIVFAPVWGLLSDRVQRRQPLIVIGFLASGIFYLSYLWVHSIPLLLTLRFIQGAFTVMAWSTLMAMVADQPDEAKRPRYMGLMGAALIFGVSIGAPVGGYLSRLVGVRAPLEVAGFLFLALAIGSLFLRDQTSLRAQVGVKAILANLLARPKLLVPYAFQFVDRYTVGLFVVVFPLYLSSLGVDDPAVRGRYLAAFLLPFSFLQYFTGRLSEKIGPYLPLLWGSGLYGLVLCLVGYSDLQGLWWVMTALGVLAAVMFPPAMTLTAQLSDPQTRASAMGGFNLAGSLGFALGPICGHWIFHQSGFGAAFMASGFLEILVVLICAGMLFRWRS